jgi:hypothetical protein
LRTLHSLTDLHLATKEPDQLEALHQLHDWKFLELQIFNGPRLLSGVLDAKNMRNVTIKDADDLAEVFREVRELFNGVLSVCVFSSVTPCSLWLCRSDGRNWRS